VSTVATNPGIKWDPAWKGTRNSWCSKHYHEARKAALRDGASDNEAKQKAKEAHALAADLWAENQI